MRSTDTSTEFVTTGAHVVLGKSPKRIVMEVLKDKLVFRELGGRKRFELPMEAAFREAVIQDPLKGGA